MHLACGYGIDWPVLVELLLERGANLEAADINGATQLLDASYYGHKNTVRVLLGNEVNVNSTRENKMTPVENLALQKTVRLLLERGADFEHKDWMGRTPLHYATCWDSYDDDSVCRMRQIDVMRALLDSGFGLEFQDKWRPNTITQGDHERSGCHAIRILILENGANLETRDNLGRTPLDIAREQGSSEVEELIVQMLATILYTIVRADPTPPPLTDL